MSEDLLSVYELADVLAVKPATIRKWAKDGIIPAIKISSKTIRFCFGDVLAALRALAARQGEGAKHE